MFNDPDSSDSIDAQMSAQHSFGTCRDLSDMAGTALGTLCGRSASCRPLGGVKLTYKGAGETAAPLLSMPVKQLLGSDACNPRVAQAARALVLLEVPV